MPGYKKKTWRHQEEMPSLKIAKIGFINRA